MSPGEKRIKGAAKKHTKRESGDVLLKKGGGVLKSAEIKRVPAIQVDANKKKKMSPSKSNIDGQSNNTPRKSVSTFDRSPSDTFRSSSGSRGVGNKTQRMGSGVHQRSVPPSPLKTDQRTRQQSSGKSSASSATARSTSASSRKTSASSATSGGTGSWSSRNKLRIVIISNTAHRFRYLRLRNQFTAV